LKPICRRAYSTLSLDLEQPRANHSLNIKMFVWCRSPVLPQGGRTAASIAANLIKPIVMELGGKSPQLVLHDADFNLAVNGVAAGIFTATGQSCISRSRAIIDRSLVDDFSKRLVEVSSKAVVGDPTDPKTHVGPIANWQHYEKVLADIQAAVDAGNRLLLDGRSACREKGYYIGPTIFADVSNDAKLAQEEVFGPVLPSCRSTMRRRLSASPTIPFTAWPRASGRGIPGA
jgi:acyl-CoA reductase-like NAD-dependent aldehyde dehydrogenase